MGINKIIIENFKVFKGEHVFDLKNLNIFTGPNNAGKSTFIKALSLFAKGLEEGDFPFIDLIEAKVGHFKDLVNWESGSESFKIGFYIELGEIKEPFKVKYEFVDGEQYGKSNKAIFSNVEVIDKFDKLLFGVYNIATFEVTSENLEFDHDEVFLEKGLRKRGIPPFPLVSIDGEPPMLISKFNIPTLRKYLTLFTDDDYSLLFDHLKDITYKNINWWQETFCEADFDNVDINNLRFTDLLNELYKDYYSNFGDIETKGIIYWGRGENLNFSMIFGNSLPKNIVDEWSNNQELFKETIRSYNEIKKATNFNRFIDDVFSILFKKIEESLRIFKRENYFYYSSIIFDNKYLSYQKKFKYLFDIVDEKWYNSFSRELLNIFGIDGFIEIKSHLNSFLELNLVTGLSEIDKELQKKEENIDNSDEEKYREYLLSKLLNDFTEKYKSCKRQNIADLGKGLSNILNLILFSFFAKKSLDKEKQQKREKRRNRKTKRMFLIEEPENYLHPAWQSKFADFLEFLMKDDDFIFIIETHSEYLIRKLQYLTAKKEIKPEDTKIYYFHDPNNIPKGEKQIKELNIREDGMIDDDFGPGFFDESVRLTMDLLKLQNNN